MRLAVLLILGAALAAPVRAYEPEGYPGSTWGEASREFDGIEGTGVIGRVTQGVRWITLPYDIPFETYAGWKVRFRSENRRFYNAHGPNLGLQLSHGALDAGFDFHWSRFPERGGENTFNNYEMFLTWYKKWNLAERLSNNHPFGIVGLPFSTWGRLAHDLEGPEGDSSMGNVTQAVDWLELPGDIVLSTFGAFRWRLRNEETRFFNAHGPSVGVELKRGPFNLGLEQSWQYLPELREQNNTTRLYLAWYVSWDLKNIKNYRTR